YKIHPYKHLVPDYQRVASLSFIYKLDYSFTTSNL
ncbi:MAG: hypothetical protein ACI9LN_001531, partial [Saprospiraceae bacterium]